MQRITIEELDRKIKRRAKERLQININKRKKKLLKKNGSRKHNKSFMKERAIGSPDNTKISIRGMATLIM